MGKLCRMGSCSSQAHQYTELYNSLYCLECITGDAARSMVYEYTCILREKEELKYNNELK